MMHKLQANGIIPVCREVFILYFTCFCLNFPAVTESNIHGAERFLLYFFSDGYIGCRKKYVPDKQGGGKMTFGEKLKNARLEAGFTQEELSSRLIVSRAAVAKWESDRGMPDVRNLKALSEILNVSVDYLLDDGNKIDLSVTKKPIDLSQFGDKGKLSRMKKIRIKEKIVRQEYPDAQIIRLTVTRIKNTRAETVVDQVVGWTALLLGGIPLFGTQEMGKTVNSLDQQYYLVNEEKKQYFVLLTDEFMVSRLMIEKQDQKKFTIEDREFLTVGEVDYLQD